MRTEKKTRRKERDNTLTNTTPSNCCITRIDSKLLIVTHYYANKIIASFSKTSFHLFDLRHERNEKFCIV
jgi:hypothetical protein